MDKVTSLLIPAMHSNWFEPIGDESLFAAAVRKAATCADIGTVFAAVSPDTQEKCVREIEKIKSFVTPILLSGPLTSSTPWDEIRYYIAGLRQSDTEWLAALHPVQANFFDPGAFLHVRAALDRQKSRMILCGATKGWDIIVLHRSILPKLEEIADGIERGGCAAAAAGILPYFLKGDFLMLVKSYRAEVSKRRGRPLNPSWPAPPFIGSSAAAVRFYRAAMQKLNVSLSDLTIDQFSDLLSGLSEAESSGPQSLWLEISAKNDAPPIYSPLSCQSLPDSYPAYMSMKIFKRTLELLLENVAWCPEVHLSGLGEPLQNPEYMDIICHVNGAFRSKPMIPAFHGYTDGHRLTAEIAEEFTTGAVSSVMISLDAVDESHYARIRPRGNFQAVQANIAAFLAMKRSRISKLPCSAGIPPVVALTTTLLAELEDHIDAFMGSQMYWSKWLKRFGKNLQGHQIQDAHEKFYAGGHMVEHMVIHGPSTYAGQSLPDRRVAVYTPLKRFLCRRLTQTIFVKTDGSIVICDRVFDPAGAAIANVMEIDSFRDVWDLMVDRRKAHVDGRYADADSRCGACEDWFIPVD